MTEASIGEWCRSTRRNVHVSGECREDYQVRIGERSAGTLSGMSEWTYAQTDPSEELARLHSFSFKKRQAERDIELVITVKEFAASNSD